MAGILRGIIGAVSLSDLRNPRLWLTDAVAGRRTHSGIDVGPESAMTLSGYYAAIRNISEDVAKLPLRVYRRRTPRGKEEVRDHAVASLLLRRPNRDMSAMTFRETLVAHAIGWGNGYAEVERLRGETAALHPIHPSRVRPLRGSQPLNDRLIGGFTALPLVYEVRNDENQIVRLPSEDVIHIRGLGGNGLQGWSICRLAAESIGLGQAAEVFGAAFFGNGASVSGVLEHPGAMSEQAVARLREQWTDRYVGAANAGKPMILEENMKWSRTGIPPEEAQFLQTRQMQVQEMARWLRMPPHKIGDLTRSTNNNIEAQNIDYVVDTLMPWMERIEQELDAKLFNADDREDHFVEHFVAGLLRGDSKSRSERQRRLFATGAYSQNDIREEEGQNPIAGGDEYYVPVNMVPSRLAARGPTQRKAPGVETDSGDARRDAMRGEAQQHAQSLRPVFEDAARRILAKESRACSRALKKHGQASDAYASWLDTFLAQQIAYVREAFAPVLAACGVTYETTVTQAGVLESYQVAARGRWYTGEELRCQTDTEITTCAQELAEEMIDAVARVADC